jgi:serine/threonine protein kinase
MESQIALYNDPNTISLPKEKKLSLLVSVLLEIVFGSNSLLYEKTVDYLIASNIIDPDIKSDAFANTRTNLLNMIMRLNGPVNVPSSVQLLTNSTDPIYSQLINIYTKTFVELCELGSGSFASVYKSKHKIDSKLYAIKKIIITDDLLDLGYDVFDEVKMLSSLSHPHVVRYYSSWVDFDLDYILKSETDSDTSLDTNTNLPILFIQTELCDYTLKDYIETQSLTDTVKNKINFWIQMVQGVQYIHSQDIIHRDIKPSNIFFSNGCIKIGDFGLSKNISSFALQISKSVEIGCAYYRAPEVENGDYDESIDLYSLGVILLEMLLQCVTFHHKVMTIRSVLDGTTDIESLGILLQTHEYNGLIERLINSNPDSRLRCDKILLELNRINNEKLNIQTI